MKTALASGSLLLAVASLLTGNFPGPQSPRGAGQKSTPNPASGAAEANSGEDKSAAASQPASAGKRKIPCKTPQNASLCYWTHGRLSVYNGNPAYRIWKIGTHRILGVYNGPSHFPLRVIADNEDPELPQNLLRAYEADYRSWKRSKPDLPYDSPSDIFADFEVCPLEPEKRGEMQAVCVESAKDIFIGRDY